MSWNIVGSEADQKQDKSDWRVIQDEERSLIYDVPGILKSGFMGLWDTATKFLGGGEDSMMAQERDHRQYLREQKYQKAVEKLQNQGRSDEEIQQKLGAPPTDPKTFNEFTNGKFIPQTEWGKRLEKGAYTAGEFAAFELMLPGIGSKAKAITPKAVAKEGMKGALFSTGQQIAQESGWNEIDQVGTGVLFSFIPEFLKGGKFAITKAIDIGKNYFRGGTLPKTSPTFLQEVGTKTALADLELSSKDLTNRVGRISDELSSEFEKISDKVAPKAFEEISEVGAADIAKETIEADQKRILNTISESPKTEQQAWKTIQNTVEENFSDLRKSYSQLYKTVESGAGKVKTVLPETYETLRPIYDELRKSIISTVEEKNVRVPLLRMLRRIFDKKGEELKPLTIGEALATRRSINRIISKADINPAPVNLLKPVSKALTNDIMKALEGSVFEKTLQSADELYIQGQKIYNNQIIRNFRKSEVPEETGKLFTSGSRVKALNEALGEATPIKNLSDRMVVENIASKDLQTARTLQNEGQEFLTQKANKALDKMLEMKDPKNKLGRTNLERTSILDDIQKASTTGNRPDYTLSLMRSPKGYELVKSTLSRSKNGKKIFNSLKKSFVNDFFETILDDSGKIDFKKTKDLLQNDNTRKVLKEVIGEEGVNFFEKLETYGKNLSENMRLLKLKDPSLYQQLLDKYIDSNLKYILLAIAPKTAALGLIGANVSKRIQRNILLNIAENRQMRDTVSKLGSKKIGVDSIQKLIIRLSQLTNKGVKKDER